MRAGKLRHRAELFVPVDGPTTSRGQVSLSHATAGVCYCEIVPLRGQDLWSAQQVRGDATHTIKMRWRADATERCRIVWNGRIWELGPPLEAELRQFEVIFVAIEVRPRRQPVG